MNLSASVALQPLQQSREFVQLTDALRTKEHTLGVYGLVDSQKSHLAAALQLHRGRQLLLITETEVQARQLAEDLSFYLGAQAHHFPSRQPVLYETEASSVSTGDERLKTLAFLAAEQPAVITASMDALFVKLPPPALFRRLQLTFRVGETIPRETMLHMLVAQGYQRADQVEEKGQFSIRGDIIDLFSPVETAPCRIELFDEEVDSIRYFDLATQQSIDKISAITISPATEWILEEKDRRRVVDTLKRMKNQSRPGSGDAAGCEPSERCAHLVVRLEENRVPHDMEGLQDLAYEKAASLLDYLMPGSLVLLDEPQRLRSRAEGAMDEWKEHFTVLLERQQVLPIQAHCLFTYSELVVKIREKTVVTLHLLPRSEKEFPAQTVVNFVTRSVPSFQGKMNWLFDELRNLVKKQYRLVLLAATKEKALKLTDALREAGLPVQYLAGGDAGNTGGGAGDSAAITSEALPSGKVTILPGSVHRGFEYVGCQYLLLSDYELFGAHKKKTTRPRRRDGRAIQSFVELKPGSFVVHENHGIGRYEGIESLTVDGITRDYLKISYAGADHLYVPTDQMDMIQKYIGAEDKTPRMNRLGGADWAKTKSRVKKAIEDMADDLLELYAKRNRQKGYVFSPDTELQQQFEYLFPYEETPDQLKSIEEVKADMEAERPMDRLLCGDVGYGKTEVALRAAFKCAADSKQCAVLVPTTILAQQHFNTFRERFSPFPVRVEMLSRFRTPTQIQKIMKDIKNGLVDVVIGTHRLLSKDVAFKDLGLLIVDEEQRFGVKHKERLKQLKANVDVLTLTATPIPRTLHMAMSGIRDMSVIEDPPEERFPVQTYVVAWNPSLVADAILRETSRGGQVYYLYNRVEGIYTIANQLADRFPELRIGVGHGQMNETELEKVMLDYYEGHYDVLVCTTIIENGLDIPNANTILVHDADQLGLSQLYQLRGRVGRSTRQGYAYLMFQRDKILSEVAEKRLKAIKEFTEFGSGFKIAMRDLEIRGAGNLLGGEQHGHMAAIGYDLYVKLLEETMQKTRGETVEAEPEVAIELNVDAYIPKEYIGNAGHKIDIYKKIAAIRSIEDRYEVENEIEDRFGDIPGIVRNLVTVSALKAMALKAGISQISQKDDTIRIQFGSGLRLNPEALARVIHDFGRRIQFNAGQQPYFTYKAAVIRDASQLLRELTAIVEILSGDAAA
ncbi:transcription-repair coupling factor [Anoxynatronum sibiricum]|uniref:Transcription-repair-coupling factor n=1 Tax=Anoxynatronum sibiricum TaxID=210623 RepID=A0ABU9VVI2_9CLOT